jgi:hypothetical protein
LPFFGEFFNIYPKPLANATYLVVAKLAALPRVFGVVERLALLLVSGLLVHSEGRKVRKQEGAGVALLPDVDNLILCGESKIIIIINTIFGIFSPNFCKKQC